MEANDPIPQDKPVEVYISWTCGDGCCSNSQRVEFKAGEIKTVDELCNALENGRGWVLSYYYHDDLWPDHYMDLDHPNVYHYEIRHDQHEEANHDETD